MNSAGHRTCWRCPAGPPKNSPRAPLLILEALIRLHGKGVMTAREALVLLRGGYSSGALARWRTLHEVWVVFLALADGDRESSRRYLDHEGVEILKAQKDYEETWQPLGHEPPDWTAAEWERARTEMVGKFDRTFMRDYGWAVPLFDNAAPKFRQLEERVDLDPWRGYYRMASHGTHANSVGLTWNIQDFGCLDRIWAGPSNAGLLDPAQCSLIAITGLTVRLMAYTISELTDSAGLAIANQSIALVRQQAMRLLVETAIKQLAEVDAQQEAEQETTDDLSSRVVECLQEGAHVSAEALATHL